MSGRCAENSMILKTKTPTLPKATMRTQCDLKLNENSISEKAKTSWAGLGSRLHLFSPYEVSAGVAR